MEAVQAGGAGADLMAGADPFFFSLFFAASCNRLDIQDIRAGYVRLRGH